MKEYIFTYITTNLINGKRYVGSHASDKIKDGYLGSGRLLIKAVKKHGRENFKREVLCFHMDRKEAFASEKMMIEKHKTLWPYGYNISPTGGGQPAKCGEENPMYGFVFSQERRDKRRYSHIGKKNNKNIPWSNESRKRVSYPILQYDLNGDFIKEWSGALDASKELKVSRDAIFRAASGINKTSCGFKWAYKHPPRGGSRVKFKDIIQKDLDGNIINKWMDVSEASDGTNISKQTIRSCLRGATYTSGGFIWEMEDCNA